jgi:hypothetical protein
MAEPFQVDASDLDKLVEFIRESGDPQSTEDLSLRFIELARQRVITEMDTVPS